MKDSKTVSEKRTSLYRRAAGFAILVVLVSILSGSALVLCHKETHAAVCDIPCTGCNPADVAGAVEIMKKFKPLWTPVLEQNIEDHLNSEENWIVEDFFEESWLVGLAELTQFLGAFGMYQVEMVGAFFDAKNDLETKRLYFQLHAEAHRDYHPGDDFCWFGTNARNMVHSESRARLNMLALSKRSLERQLGVKHSSAAFGADADKQNRWDKFVATWCDPKDNGWSEAGTGLDLACDRDGSGSSTAAGATDKNRVNRDIDYTRLIDEPRTLDVNFSEDNLSEDEEDVIAMAENLYGNQVMSRRLSRQMLKHPAAQNLYLDLRSVAAKRNIAEHSFHALVAMKSRGTTGDPNDPSFMAAIIKDLMPAGTPDEEVFALIGENPSYYAQLELLGKKIYQNPDFFASLYDKPANVKRKSVAMKAVGLMLDRALFESELRQEMMLSVMLSGKLGKDFKTINRALKIERDR